jgi:sterol desaturase/sphingolipid hydroxylase (fatty acid hydroxylase superfamily)
MLFLFVLVVSLVCASFFGHVIHWSLHQPWTGPAHRGHMEHHKVLYPPGKLVSDRYKPSKWYHSGPLLFTPPLFFLLAVFGGILWLCHAPIWTLAVFGGSLVGFGLVNDWFHDSFHLRKHGLLRFKWYRQLRVLHYFHHHDMKVNYGIVSFVWDRAFGTHYDRRRR